MNKWIFCGWVATEPKFSATKEGTEIAKFSVAVPKVTNYKENSLFNVAAFGPKVSKFIKPFIKKGDKILCSCIVQYDEFEKDGEKRKFLNIIIDEIERAGTRSSTSDSSTQDNKTTDQPASDIAQFTPIPDEELPF